ncbi:H(+)-ATPase [Lobosporangium transversale]|uniref:Plasma membrane ATPase n=1 Tax=Lobosporangium transversale TaxID=64571 RepID=A0A1Y2GLQ9_9FUNG|nr:H(+)-ATPase [Lobosporangium transversale]ORZ14852.1 H(+)-ATPase [Lobosporangium transversale]|eukprot:XP_021880984.1 H(+)-ATPase [Lobosporangium transversale]
MHVKIGKEKGRDIELEDLLRTDPMKGLTTEQASQRLRTFGPNELVEVKDSKILKFLSYFSGPIAFLIELACIISVIVKDWLNFAIILGLLFTNAIIGYVEEARAESAVDALRQTLALKTRCWRDGSLQELDASVLVPGDVIVLRLGDIVPADARLLGIGASGVEPGSDLLIDQSSLTGEALPSHKKKGDEVYSSTIVKQGQQMAIVTKTGSKTYIGVAAHLTANTKDESHFQKVIGRIGNFLILFTFILVVLIIIFQFITFRNDPVRGQVLKILGPVLILAVAAIPVGLPTVCAVTMAVGARGLASKKVIVKRLAAVEEMSALSILCSDKTGTLTMNELTFDEPYLCDGYSAEDLLLYSYLASEFGARDPIELAVRSAAEHQVSLLRNRPVSQTNKVPGFDINEFLPFNPVVKYTQATVTNTTNDTTFLVAKGAPQVIIRMVGGDDAAVRAYVSMAKRGLRALGVARTVAGTRDKWQLVGLISLLDPPRPDSAETIERCQRMGIAVKMVTGDQQIIAKEVSRRLGLGQVILDASHISNPDATEHDQSEQVYKADGFAEVIPEHKYRIVEILQKRGLLVGMTGDGVNDAPALKRANVGIAVQGCTDAARSAADIVLMAPGLATIVEGILASRAIFQRIQSYALYRITSTVHFLIFFFVVVLAYDWTLPANLLILICILNDAATLVIAVDNAQVSVKPDKWRVGRLIFMSCFLGLLLTALSFGHFYYFWNTFNYFPHPEADGEGVDRRLDSIMYLHISSAPHFLIFSTRLPGYFWENMPSMVFLVVIIGTQAIALLMVIFGWLTPAVPVLQALAVFGISLVSCLVLDVIKVQIFKYWPVMSESLACAPFGSRRHLLKKRKQRAIQQKRVWQNIEHVYRLGLKTQVIVALQNADGKIPPPLTAYDDGWGRNSVDSM